MSFSGHNKSGFTLLEAMMAILIIGFAITALLTSQNSLVQRIAQRHGVMARLTITNNMLYDPELLQKRNNRETITKTIDDPPTQISLQILSTDQNFTLKKFSEIALERVQAVWNNIYNVDQDMVIGSIQFNPQKKQQS